MKTEDIDRKIGMPDIDMEWAKFEKEVIDASEEKSKMESGKWEVNRNWSRAAMFIGIIMGVSLIALASIYFYPTPKQETENKKDVTDTTSNIVDVIEKCAIRDYETQSFPTLKSEIEYFEENEQEIIKKKCIKKIPVGKIEHDGEHECQTEVHKCGFICRQCERLCELDYGHNDQHYCLHGQIKNCRIQTEEDKLIINYLSKLFSTLIPGPIVEEIEIFLI